SSKSLTRVAATGIAVPIAVMIVLLLVSPTGLVVHRPPLSSPVCSDGHPQVCVWPEDSAFLPEVVEMADRVAEATRDVMGVPERFVQYGVGDYDIINSFQFAAPGSGRWFTAG